MTTLKRAIVTGATGFIGSRLANRLAGDGIDVVCPVRRTGRSGALERVPNIRVIELGSADDPSNSLDYRELNEPTDAFFHLAAYGVNPAQRDPVRMHQGHVELSTAALLAAESCGARRFVFAGSCSEYAPAEPGTLIGSDHPVRPTTLYGAAKAAAHIYTRTLAAARSVPFVGLRLFGTFGIGEAPQRLVPHLISRFLKNERPHLTPGDQQRDFTYIDDVVEALLVAATHPDIEPGAAFNVCSGTPTSIADMARIVAGQLNVSEQNLGLGVLPYRPDEPMWIVGDASEFQHVTGWQARLNVEEGVARMVSVARAT